MIAIDREKTLVLGKDEMVEFVSKLKPFEVEALWEILVDHEIVQKKTSALLRISGLVEEIELNIHELMESRYELERQIKLLKEQLNYE